jgi:hypothetical protein
MPHGQIEESLRWPKGLRPLRCAVVSGVGIALVISFIKWVILGEYPGPWHRQAQKTP